MANVAAVPPSRRDAALDAAIEVLGTGGSRALTHRAVDQAGGLPEGTTSNYFRTREALVAGVLRHISTAESAPLDDLLPPSGLTVDDLVRISAERVEYLLGPGRALTLARHALFLEAAWTPSLRADLLAESRYWWDLGTALLTQLGCPDPGRRSRWLFAYVDGLLADQLARPDPEFDAAAAVRAGLEGLLGRVG
jgi:AcrR family transcriptional regulator